MDKNAIDKVLGGSVDDAKGKLDGLNREQLQQLHDAEEKGQKRTTMLSAIDSAIKALPEQGGNPSASDARFTQDDMDEALAKQKERLDAERDHAVAEARGEHAKAQAKPAPDAMMLAKAVEAPSLTALTETTTIQFVDDRDIPIDGLSPMTFAASDYKPSGDTVTLDAEVDFPKGIPANEVSGAFMLNGDDQPIAKARLVMPFAIGGGRTARLGKQTLQFAR